MEAAMAKYKCPPGCDSVTLMDVVYKPDANGVIEVPGIPHDLEKNGFVPFDDKAQPAPRPTSGIAE
jgi:hypothetical protein